MTGSGWSSNSFLEGQVSVYDWPPAATLSGPVQRIDWGNAG